MCIDICANIYRINMFSQNYLASSDEALQEYFKSCLNILQKPKGIFLKHYLIQQLLHEPSIVLFFFKGNACADNPLPITSPHKFKIFKAIRK